jgi:hypothetical protein
VKAGKVTLVGWATVDGQRAIHLTEHLAIRDDYRWLPATQANLRLLTPAGAIPAGFTQTSPDQGQ